MDIVKLQWRRNWMGGGSQLSSAAQRESVGGAMIFVSQSRHFYMCLTSKCNHSSHLAEKWVMESFQCKTRTGGILLALIYFNHHLQHLHQPPPLLQAYQNRYIVPNNYSLPRCQFESLLSTFHNISCLTAGMLKCFSEMFSLLLRLNRLLTQQERQICYLSRVVLNIFFQRDQL